MAECLATLARSAPAPSSFPPAVLLVARLPTLFRLAWLTTRFVAWHTHTLRLGGIWRYLSMLALKFAFHTTTTTHILSLSPSVCVSFVWPYNKHNNKANALCALTQFPF